MKNPWNREREDLLRKLFSEGVPAGKVAIAISKLGSHVTKFAVVGRAKKLGVDLGYIIKKPVKACVSPTLYAKTMELNRADCRYIHGDTQDHSVQYCRAPIFCGAYCEEHHHLCKKTPTDEGEG